MEDNRSNIEVLKDFARRTNREIYYKEEEYPMSGYRKIPQFRYFVFIPINENKTSFFVLFSDPYYTIGQYTVFCGVFTELPFQIEGKVNIRKRNIIDKLNPFEKRVNADFVSNRFSKNTVLFYEYESDLRKLLNNVMVEERILDVVDKSDLMHVSINEYNVDFVPELKGKTCLSVVNPQSWVFEDAEIEEYFKLVERVREHIKR